MGPGAYRRKPPATVSLAVFGAGGWGKNLIRVLSRLDGVELRAICDVSESALAPQRAGLPDVRCTTSAEDVLGDPEIEAVVIAVDAPAHFALARAALRAGKHVMVEKPLTFEPATSAELVALAAAQDRRLMVGHLLLYHPAMRMVGAQSDTSASGAFSYMAAS